MEKHRCKMCPATYLTSSSLYRHIRCKHSNRDDRNFTCVLCGYSTPRSDCLKLHQNTVHRTERENKVFCTLCEHSSPTRNEMLHHYTLHHNLIVREDSLEFCSENEFYEWKRKIEKETLSEFVRARGPWVKVANESTRLFFKCHRDGVYKPSGRNVRRMKISGSNKIGGHCPSRMDVTVLSSGKVKVLFCSTHIGHQTEISRLRLSKTDKDEIAVKIALQIPFDCILDSFRYPIQDSGLERRSLLSKKDLHNIAHGYNLKSEVVRRSNVETWVKDLQLAGSVVLFYKPKGHVSEEYELCGEDFILIIMNEAQKEVLNMYGNKCVCMDSIRGLNEYSFELTSLIVLDEQWQGFPCAFMFSNRDDVQVMEVFLSIIKDTLEIPLETDVLMSDTEDVFLNAWCKVMTPPKQRLFCSWEVDRAWRKNLSKIKGRENQAETYKIIRTLMEHNDENTFEEFLEEALIYMKEDPDISEFGVYFENKFKDTSPSWSYCYRQHKDLDKNMDLEKIHDMLDHIYQKGMMLGRLDLVTHSLLRYLRDKLYGRLLHLSNGSRSSKIIAIKQRHKSSLRLRSEDVVYEDGEWKITPGSDKEPLIVKRLEDNPCNCELRCSDCKTCIHEYSCSCVDSAIKFNMCKHIHLICKFVSEDFVSSSELFIDSNICDNEIIVESQDPATSMLQDTLEQKQEQLLQKFHLCLNEANSEEACDYISNSLTSLLSTLKAIKSESPDALSSKISTLEPKKKSVSTKRKMSEDVFACEES